MHLGKKKQLDIASIEQLEKINSLNKRLRQLLRDNKTTLSTPLKYTDNELRPMDNKAFFQFEQDLLHLLLDIDSVSLYKEQRKELVLEIQGHLKKLDTYKTQQLAQGQNSVLLLGIAFLLLLGLFILIWKVAGSNH
jgi:hypothetical protein